MHVRVQMDACLFFRIRKGNGIGVSRTLLRTSAVGKTFGKHGPSPITLVENLKPHGSVALFAMPYGVTGHAALTPGIIYVKDE